MTTTPEKASTTKTTARPIGAHYAATRLAEATGLLFEANHIRLLAARGDLTAAGTHKGHPVYRHADLDELVATRPDLLAVVVTDNLLGRKQAADRLGIRHVDFDNARKAGLITPATTTSSTLGSRRHGRALEFELFAVSDVDMLPNAPGIDWNAVLACVGTNRRSPLRALLGDAKPRTRADVIREWIAGFADLHNVEVFACYRGMSDCWEITWEQRDGGPTPDDVRQALAADPRVSPHSANIVLSTAAGAATLWARTMLDTGAVILDTETTDLDGSIIELAVIDSVTGEILLDTLVHPGDVAISPSAQAVHGISMADLAGKPTWDEVLPELLAVTRGKPLLAYNSEFDSGRVLHDCARYRLAPEHLADPDTWGCLMNRRTDWTRSRGRLRLSGGHRARHDCLAAREVLFSIAQRRLTPRVT